MKPAPFKYFAPTSIEEALDALDALGYDGKVLAGGQSLIAAMNFRMAQPAALVDLNNIPELFFIRPAAEGGISIGTMTRSSTMEHDRMVKEKSPLIHEAMPNVAHPQIRNRGTFGGAIAHADPAGQAPALAIALKARMKVSKKGASKWVEADDFFMGPFTSVIEPSEMLEEVIIPALPARTGCCYQHVARQSGATSLVGCSTVVTLDDKKKFKDVRIVLSSVGETPLLANDACGILLGNAPSEELFKAAADAASKEADPGSDIHATEAFRRHLVNVLVRRTLKIALERANA